MVMVNVCLIVGAHLALPVSQFGLTTVAALVLVTLPLTLLVVGIANTPVSTPDPSWTIAAAKFPLPMLLQPIPYDVLQCGGGIEIPGHAIAP